MWFWVAAATIVAVVLASIYLLKKPATKPQAPKSVDQPIKTVAPPTIHERTPVTKKEIPHNLSDESPENSTWDDSEMESPVLSEEQMELIRPVTSRDLKLLSLKSQIINLNPGEVLIREGTPIVSGEVFQHLSGVLTVTRGAEKINTIPEYSILGEFCIIRTGNAPYSIIAESPCKVAKISTALLFTLFQDNPSFAKRFYVMVGRKLAEELRRKNSPNSISTSEISESSLFDEEMESSETQTPRHSLLRRSKKDDETKNKEYDIQVAKRFLLPETEIALQRFRVSWKRQSKNRSGTLYVTPNFICFYSKVFGSVKKELQLIVDCTFEIDQKAKLLICKGSYKTLEFSFSKLDRLEKAFQLLGEVKGAATTQEAKGEDSPKTPDNDTHSPILTDKEWKKLLPKNATVYEESDVIVAQGSVEQKVIQLQGDCVVVLKENNQTKIIAELSDGDIVGEMNFMSNLPASASIIANAEVTAYSISKAQLNALWNTNPQIVVKFYHYLCFVIASRLLK